MIRVLHSVSYMHRAGVETFLMNYYRHMDHSLIQFDFLCNVQTVGCYDEEIRSLGGRLFYRPDPDKLKEQFYAAFWQKFIYEHPEIKIIHAHNGAKQYYPLEGARQAGLPIRIAHAHISDFPHDGKYTRRLELLEKATAAASFRLGCCDRAGSFFFGEKAWKNEGILIHNAIPCEQYSFDPEVRKKLRCLLGIENCYVIGHVGRFAEQKNHVRLLNIFCDVYRNNPNARLLLIGTGELEDNVKNYAASLGIRDSVLFCGERFDTYNWYQAMDVFVMPSLFEGVTLSGIEAQASGLPCVFSDMVAAETMVTDDVCFMPLDASDTEWSTVISRYEKHSRRDTSEQLRKAGYDVREEAIKLQSLYCQLVEQSY